MIVNNTYINKKNKPYIIAELSANHNGNLERAKQSILLASKTGISAIKIQSYTPETMTININKSDFIIKEGLWAGRTLYDLYSEAYTPFEWHDELFSFAKKLGITLFSTPFDESAVDLLEELNTPAYKIASFEILDIPLIKYIAKKNKPIFLSTGMASKKEIINAVETIKNESNAELLLFHCVSSYPAITKESNLNNINWLKKTFKVEVGLSDHTQNNMASIISIGMGAVAIEKHFKIDDNENGPDSSFSLNIKQLKLLVKECNEAWTALGNSDFQRAESESENKIFRRSLYFVSNLEIGQTIKYQDIRRIRPGFGLDPEYLEKIIGKKVKKKIEIGDPVSWDVI